MQSESSGSPQIPPHIIARPEHTVSRRDIEVEALKVLYRLHHAGYTAYLVGGGVRDLLLGKTPKDFDVVTDARPGELRKLFRNSRIIGRRFRLVQVFFKGGHIVEVSTFRCRSEFDELAEPEAGPAKETTYGTPAEDAQRRDLTINGLFYNIADFSLVDYVGGMEDLEAKRIRVIGEPSVRFVRDPVRMLRVLRHAARIGFTIDAAAWEEILAQGHLIRTCPPARVRDELLKDFHSGAARPFFELMLELKAVLCHLPGLGRKAGGLGGGPPAGVDRPAGPPGPKRLPPVRQPAVGRIFNRLYRAGASAPGVQRPAGFHPGEDQGGPGGHRVSPGPAGRGLPDAGPGGAAGAAVGQGPAHPGPPDPAAAVFGDLAAASIQDRAGGGTAGTL